MIVYSLTNSEDIHYIAKSTKGDNLFLDVTGLTGAEYVVSTFALENRLPLLSVVASPKNVTVLNGHQGWWIALQIKKSFQGLPTNYYRQCTRAATTYRV